MFKRTDGFRSHVKKHITFATAHKLSNETDSDGNFLPSTSEEKIVDEEVRRSDEHTESDLTELSESQERRRWRCDQCSKDFASRNSLRNHARFYHTSPDYISATRYLGGTCVDPDRGIYMIRRSFKGNSNPVHVMHNFGANGGFSCELNECRELSNTAKRSKNPNFICCHLKSVQYVSQSSISLYILPREPLQELLSKKVSWFKSKREDECVKLQNKALQDKAPIIAEFSGDSLASTRYRHFSVYDGDIHHYARFKRVVVTYDTHQNKWGCSCCRTKVNCVHKCIAKWFMYAKRPDDLLLTNTRNEENDGDLLEEDNFLDTSEIATADSSMQDMVFNYPPKQEDIISKMVKYLHGVKRIPPNLPRNVTHDLKNYKKKLIPSEENCFHCDVILSDPIQVTRKGKIFTTTEVIEGLLYTKIS